MNAVRLTLPFPPKELSPNYKPWTNAMSRRKAAVTADYREECAWEAVAIRREWYEGQTGHFKPRPMVPPPVRATVTFVVPDRRKRDLDNLCASMKAAWDGLVDAGVLGGDDAERFSVYADVQYVKGESHVIVELGEAR